MKEGSLWVMNEEKILKLCLETAQWVNKRKPIFIRQWPDKRLISLHSLLFSCLKVYNIKFVNSYDIFWLITATLSLVGRNLCHYFQLGWQYIPSVCVYQTWPAYNCTQGRRGGVELGEGGGIWLVVVEGRGGVRGWWRLMIGCHGGAGRGQMMMASYNGLYA